jgi:myosin heavy subunit
MNDLANLTSSRRTPSPSKSALAAQTTSENKHLANLLDFDIPPPPTPRSMPSITARELESLKSEFLSQISGLKASLSGREAEVKSLKEAVGDAERRVGEGQETIREERGIRESLQSEKEDWARRGREMEEVLRSVKEEMREKEDLVRKLEDSERRREEAETRAQEVTFKLDSMKAERPPKALTDTDGSGGSPGRTNREVELAVEKVARELHALYKSKHETKVIALKKSYEQRWEKRVKELERKVEDLVRENDELRVGRDATMSGPIKHTMTAEDAEREAAKNEEEQKQKVDEARLREELKAKLAGLSGEIEVIKGDNHMLRRELEQERSEKGDLVAAVEEMLAVTAAQAAGDEAAAKTGLDNLRGSISRAGGKGITSGGGGFGFGSSVGSGSRIGIPTLSGSIGHARNTSASKVGIISSIERMGKGGRVD